MASSVGSSGAWRRSRNRAIDKPAPYRTFYPVRDPRDMVVSWYFSMRDTHRVFGPIARANNVTVVIKPHAGNTNTGRDCSQIVKEVADEGIKVCYDSGNVLGYVHVDPIADIRTCWKDVRAFIIKDHRDTFKDEDCGPGLGEIDHFKLLLPVARTGLTMPLACENIWAPTVPRPEKDAAAVDSLARRAREFLEIVVSAIQAA